MRAILAALIVACVAVAVPHGGAASGTLVVRHGLDGAVVPDASVGGHTGCGEWPGTEDAWNTWGNFNYQGYDQVVVENQWDVADRQCGSKYYVTFPLAGVPQTARVLSASVRLWLFGNAGYQDGDAQPSAIDSFVIGEDWSEDTLTWNNAPLPIENVGVTWVQPKSIVYSEPPVPYEWDVAYAADRALRMGAPLRLAFYSSDGDYHSGKYFWSSDCYKPEWRPALTLVWTTGAAPRAPERLEMRRGES